MTQIAIDFEWGRDADGRRFVLENGSIRPGPEFKRRPGDLTMYRPLLDSRVAQRLLMEFANINRPADALAFVNAFGPLTEDGRNKKGDAVSFILRNARHANLLLSLAGEARREGRGEITDEGAEDLAGVLEDWSAWWGFIQVRVLPADNPFRALPRLVLTPPDLLHAIRFLVAQKIAEGPAFRRCRYCNDLFEVGSAVGRTLKAKFCSSEHQKLSHQKAKEA